MHWHTLSCEHDSAFGCLIAGRRLAFDSGAMTAAARALYARACKLGMKSGCTEPDEADSESESESESDEADDSEDSD